MLKDKFLSRRINSAVRGTQTNRGKERAWHVLGTTTPKYRQLRIAVFSAGPQPRGPRDSVPRRTSTASSTKTHPQHTTTSTTTNTQLQHTTTKTHPQHTTTTHNHKDTSTAHNHSNFRPGCNNMKPGCVTIPTFCSGKTRAA